MAHVFHPSVIPFPAKIHACLSCVVDGWAARLNPAPAFYFFSFSLCTSAQTYTSCDEKGKQILTNKQTTGNIWMYTVDKELWQLILKG